LACITIAPNDLFLLLWGELQAFTSDGDLIDLISPANTQFPLASGTDPGSGIIHDDVGQMPEGDTVLIPYPGPKVPDLGTRKLLSQGFLRIRVFAPTPGACISHGSTLSRFA
jgi:hypothetical protein